MLFSIMLNVLLKDSVNKLNYYSSFIFNVIYIVTLLPSRRKKAIKVKKESKDALVKLMTNPPGNIYIYI